MRADMAFYLFIGVYALSGILFLDLVGALDQAAFSAYLPRWPLVFALLLPAIALLTDTFMLVHKFRRHRMLAAKRLFSQARLARLFAGIVLLMALGVFQGAFTSIKNALPFWRGGFIHEAAYAKIDALIHLGNDPWRYLYRVAGTDPMRMVIEWNYNIAWFMICFGALFFVTTSPLAATIRTRYLLCFGAVWILIGNVFAGIFLSAGPAFYGFVTGDITRYGDLLAFLARGAASPNSAATYQNYLWTLHEAGQAGFASGISAFPSVHVGLITLNALFLYEYHRKLGLAAFAYVAFVTASSVYLAWHYAIDGYASVAITLSIYFIVRKWAVSQQRSSGGTAAKAHKSAAIAGLALDPPQADKPGCIEVLGS